MLQFRWFQVEPPTWDFKAYTQSHSLNSQPLSRAISSEFSYKSTDDSVHSQPFYFISIEINLLIPPRQGTRQGVKGYMLTVAHVEGGKRGEG